MLTRQEILEAIAARARNVAIVNVPEWGGDVGIRKLDASDMERTGMADGRRDADVFAKVIACAVTNDEGEQLFNEEDVEALGKIDMETCVRVFAEVMRVNNLLDSDMEEAVKAFVEAQPESSSSS